MLWNAGNIASIYAVQPPLGFAVGYPVTQVCTPPDDYSSCCSQQGLHSRQYSFDLCGGDSCSVVCVLAMIVCVQCCTLVAGLLGIIVYQEIQGAKLICAWFFSACVLLSGAAMLGYFGSSA
jgi:hypothetical protein